MTLGTPARVEAHDRSLALGAGNGRGVAGGQQDSLTGEVSQRCASPWGKTLLHATSFAAVLAMSSPWCRAPSKLARLALALGAGDRCSPIRRAADDLLKRHLSGMAMGQTYNDHAEVHQVRDNREEGCFIAAVLSSAGGERSADLAMERAAHPIRRPAPKTSPSPKAFGQSESERRRQWRHNLASQLALRSELFDRV